MRRMSKYVQSKGREVMGWDELTQSQILMLVYSAGEVWVNYIKSYNHGSGFVMTSCRVMYLCISRSPNGLNRIPILSEMMHLKDSLLNLWVRLGNDDKVAVDGCARFYVDKIIQPT